MSESPARLGLRPEIPWAKLRRIDDPPVGRVGPRGRGPVVAWCSLIDHSADVAALFLALVRTPVVASRLARLAGLERLDPRLVARLGVLAALHDFGKANHGFQNRWNPAAPAIGHVREAWDGLLRDDVRPRLCAVLPFEAMIENGDAAPIVMAIGHHGYPLHADAHLPRDASLWRPAPHHDPVASLAPLGAAIRQWLPEAFAADVSWPRPTCFWHLVSGLLTLADWIASDETLVPLSPPGAGEGEARFTRIRAVAPDLLRRIGFDAQASRIALGRAPSFASISPFSPTPAQCATGEADRGQVLLLESETGSGKTEAALFRFARLFQAGMVDGLYVALPTRVAATALHRRVRAVVERLWPDGATRPAVVLAVPGQERGEDPGLELPPGGIDAWTSEASKPAWAGERPKRYLAGSIAVGTIDQALLAIIKAKHAHLRLAGLSRHLLVVDEVHASDRYMETLLAKLLAFHRASGGHALLLSATLGARARSSLLGGEVPPLDAAIAAPYPALSCDEAPGPRDLARAGRDKAVALRLWPGIDDPVAIAAEAAAAAHAGAKVLVVRNTRRAAIGTFLALRACAPEAPVLACNGVPTLHHGRFAREDRARLDAALEAGIGKERPGGGLVVIGTQTLEQSLDIDADLIITDLCPADVLLQRIGRLHRHHGRTRPPGFEEPRALILSPPALAPLIERPAHGLGASEAFAGPYPDLVGLEATRRLVALEPVWTIPAMNRRLVEMTTHPQALAALGEDLVSTDAAWRAATNRNGGRCFAHVSQASGAILRTDCGFGAPPNVFSSDDAAATRLGARDLLIELAEPVAGPFGAPVSGFALPDYWCGRIEAGGDLTARVTREAEGRLRLEIQGVAFAYDALGLRLARP